VDPGDAAGSVIVTGQSVDVRVLLGSEHGARLEKLPRLGRPSKELRRVPLRSVPDQPADSIDRDQEARAIASSRVSVRNTLNVYGEAGIGKTYALLRALGDDRKQFRAKAVYVHGAGALDDVLQAVFDAFYERSPPSRSPAPELRKDLGRIGGLLILDGVDLDGEDGERLQLVLSHCPTVIVSREQLVWDGGTPLAIGGLQPQSAIQLVESEIGRRLEPSERGPAERVCVALDGHPLRIREAVALLRVEGGSLAQLTELIDGTDPRKALAAARVAGAAAARRSLFETLALFGDKAIGREHVSALIDAPDGDALIDDAVARRDLRVEGERLRLGLTAADAARSLELGPAGDRALAHFVRWGRVTYDEPQAQLIEGPALLELLRWAVANDRLHEAIELGRVIDSAFVVGRRFGAWRELLELVRSAASDSGDRAGEAWAVHQLGTRAAALGQLVPGTELLRDARAMRRELGDQAGAAVTGDNVLVAQRITRARRAIWRNPFLLLLIVGLIAAAVVSAVGHHKAPAQNGGGPFNHNVVAVSSPGPQRTAVDRNVTLQIKASDSASAKLSYGAGGLPPGLTVNASSGLITGTPDKSGSYDVTIGAVDTTGATSKAQFTWTVTR
jgi:hypothetical protein